MIWSLWISDIVYIGWYYNMFIILTAAQKISLKRTGGSRPQWLLVGFLRGCGVAHLAFIMSLNTYRILNSQSVSWWNILYKLMPYYIGEKYRRGSKRFWWLKRGQVSNITQKILKTWRTKEGKDYKLKFSWLFRQNRDRNRRWRYHQLPKRLFCSRG